MLQLFKNKIFRTVSLAFLVLISLWGGITEPPEFFKYASRNIPFFRKVFKFIFYTLLVYAVSGDKNLVTVITISAIVFLVSELIKFLETTLDVEY